MVAGATFDMKGRDKTETEVMDPMLNAQMKPGRITRKRRGAAPKGTITAGPSQPNKPQEFGFDDTESSGTVMNRVNT